MAHLHEYYDGFLSEMWHGDELRSTCDVQRIGADVRTRGQLQRPCHGHMVNCQDIQLDSTSMYRIDPLAASALTTLQKFVATAGVPPEELLVVACDRNGRPWKKHQIEIDRECLPTHTK